MRSASLIGLHLLPCQELGYQHSPLAAISTSATKERHQMGRRTKQPDSCGDVHGHPRRMYPTARSDLLSRPQLAAVSREPKPPQRALQGSPVQSLTPQRSRRS